MSGTTDIADAIRARHLDRPFGVVRLWGFGLVRPNDQQWRVVSVHQEAERLDLVLVHEGRVGLAGVMSIWAPEGLETAPEGTSAVIVLRAAQRIAWDGNEAWTSPDGIHLRTPRGQGVAPSSTEPALLLST